MRPLRLCMQAFGPYAEVQVLDFGQLGAHQLFLIHGPTGAGKSAILDGICYALYGDTSGNERSARQMRSDHADPALLTEVSLDFSLGAHIYRVSRSPDQERAKLRGEGSTQQAARATLWDRTGSAGDDEGHVLADRSSTVTGRINTLLGFTAAEFRQVVVLPQGQFQHLLTSGSEEREKVLETLFRTEQYRHLQEALSTARKSLQMDVEQARSARDVLLGQSSSESVDVLEATLERHQEQLVVLRAGLGAHKTTRETAQGQIESAKKIIATLEELESAEAAFSQIESAAEDNEGKRTKLARARRAVPVVETLRARDQAAAELLAADAALGKAVLALEAGQVAFDLAKGAFDREDARNGERDAALTELAQLDSLAHWAVDRTNAISELQSTSNTLVEVEAALRAVAKSHAAVEIRERELASLCQAARERSAQIQALTTAVRLAGLARDGRSSLSAAAKAVAEQTLRLAAADKLVRAAEKAALSARAELNKLELVWRAGQAGVLAHTLEGGKPCPVCGSTRHPSPAPGKRNVPREEDLESQRESAQALEEDLDESKEQVSAAAVELATSKSQAATLRKQLGEDADASARTLSAAVRRAEESLAEAHAESERLPKLEKESVELQGRKSADRKKAERLAAEKDGCNSRLVELQATITQAERELPIALRDSTALAAATQEVKHTRAALEAAIVDARAVLDSAAAALASATSNLEGLKERAKRAKGLVAGLETHLRERIASADFLDERDLMAAAVSDAIIDALEGQLREFDAKFSDAKGRFDRASQSSAGLAKPDLDALARASHQAEQTYTEAIRNEERLASLAQQCSELLARVRLVEQSLRDFEARYSVVGRIADVAEGRNPRGVPFHRFVLASLLDDVLREASQRLRLMSNTRYTLVRGDQQRDRRSTTGLDLEVFDAYTGTTRAVVTLSGGETFLASLALALGLADIVQAYAGGIRLDAVFVDEGFGSLDPESLDLALRALVDLQKGGRLVGVISHVPEMKERIPAQLKVAPSRRGSHARFVIEA